MQAELPPQVQAYLLWCEERGLVSPVKRSFLKVIFVADELNAGDSELLAKMAAAMNLTNTDYMVMNVGPDLDSMPGAKAIVTLGDVAADAVASATMKTLHPRDLRRQPALKRQAWQDLQVVMASLAARTDA